MVVPGHSSRPRRRSPPRARAQRSGGYATAAAPGPRPRGRPPAAHEERSRGLLTTAALAAAASVLVAPVAKGALATGEWAAAPVAVESLLVVRQAGDVDCGPAVVATLAAWAGRDAPLELVTAQASSGPDGVSLAEFARLASLHGVDGSWYAASRERLGTLRTPFVAHLQRGGRGHFVAVAAIGSEYAVVADPAFGAMAAPAAELLRHYSGRVFLLDEPVAPRWEGA